MAAGKINEVQLCTLPRSVSFTPGSSPVISGARTREPFHGNKLETPSASAAWSLTFDLRSSTVKIFRAAAPRVERKGRCTLGRKLMLHAAKADGVSGLKLGENERSSRTVSQDKRSQSKRRPYMNRFKNSLLPIVLVTAMLAAPLTVFPDNEGLHKLSTPAGGVAFEVVGQVTNFPPPSPGQPATSQQYGYLSLINGLNADQIFTTATPTLQNETTARFTFFTDAVTERVISNGRLRIVNRTGTTTIYVDATPNGDFSNRDSFRDGTPVLTMAYRQQVILDTGEAVPGLAGTGTFTVINLLTVTEVQTFEIGGERYQLAKQRDQFRQFYSGAPPATTPPIGVFAGYAIAIERAQPEND